MTVSRLPGGVKVLRHRLGLSLLAFLPVAAPAEPPSTEERVEYLRRELARHDELYFRAATPEISDAAYDALKEELASLLDAEKPDASPLPLGDDRQPGARRGPHRERMLSLDKVYSDEALVQFLDRLPAGAGVHRGLMVEPKLDGVAVSLTYAQGRLVQALSRGNGREGDDLTANVRAVAGVPRRLKPSTQHPWPEHLEVRGEIVLPLVELDRLNAERSAAGEPPFAHARNVAAGSVRLGDPAEVARRGLAFFAHSVGRVEPAESLPATQELLHAQWRAWGLPVVAVEPCDETASAMLAAVERRRVANLQDGLPTDGVVVKVADLRRRDLLGQSPVAPRWAVARKFPATQVFTEVRRIAWETGRSGRLTPVAEVEPVAVDGSLVSRVSLHHAAELARLDVRVGDRVAVARAGGVIPAIVAIERAARPGHSHPEAVPVLCPDCHERLDPEAGGPRCLAPGCPARLQRSIEHFAGPAGLGLTGLGPALVARLIAAGSVRHVADLYALPPEALPAAEGERILAALERSRSAPFERWLTALGLPGVGPARARQLAERFGTFAVLAAASPEEFQDAGLSAAAAAALADVLQEPEWRRTFARLIALRIAPPAAPAR